MALFLFHHLKFPFLFLEFSGFILSISKMLTAMLAKKKRGDIN